MRDLNPTIANAAYSTNDLWEPEISITPRHEPVQYVRVVISRLGTHVHGVNLYWEPGYKLHHRPTK